MKALIPPSKFTRELFAKFAGLFFAWLIGSSEVRFVSYINVVLIIKVNNISGKN